MKSKQLDGKPYYIYVYFDVRKGKEGEPIYVGKSNCSSYRKDTSRMFQHWENRETHSNRLFKGVLCRIAAVGLVPIMKIDRWYDDEEKAFKRERSLIAKYGTRGTKIGTLCNLTDGGQGTSGRKIPLNERKKRSKLTKDYFQTEQGLKQRKDIAERWANPEFKTLVTEKIKVGLSSIEVRKRLSKAIKKGQKKSNAATKISEASKQHWKDLEYIAKVAAAKRETMNSEAEKVRKSEASKKMWSDPKRRAMIAEKIKLSKASSEIRKMISKKAKAVWTEGFREEFSKKMKEKCNTPESLEKRAEAARVAWARRKA
jgi:hypothetical protein